jgi:hypothetical protein
MKLLGTISVDFDVISVYLIRNLHFSYTRVETELQAIMANKICLNEMCSKVRIGKQLCLALYIHNCLKHE